MIALLLACHRDPGPDTGPTIDTGWVSDTGDWRCADRLMGSAPAPGASDWYWRDPLVARVGTRADGVYDAWVVDAEGVPVDAAVAWNGELPELVVTPEAPLAPSSTYALVVQDCEGLQFVPFATSSFGTPLDGGPRSLVDAAYAVRLQDGVWDSPPGIGGLIALYLDWPVLLGVQFANEDLVDLIGAQGYYANDAARQLTSAPTWDYPLANFAAQPFVDATAPEIAIAASSSTVLPVYDFRLRATFAPDGSAIGGARVSGLGDTRALGAALDLGDEPGAVCEAAEAFGAACVPCPDGQPWCLPLEAHGLSGARVDGLVVVPVP